MLKKIILVLVAIAIIAVWLTIAGRYEKANNAYWDHQMEACGAVGYYQAEDGDCVPVEYLQANANNF